MKPVSKTDWHARIVHFPYVQVDDRIPINSQCNDFCSYTRWFLFKLLILIPIFCLFVGYLSGIILGELAGMLVTGTIMFSFTSVFLVVTFVITLVLVLYKLRYKLVTKLRLEKSTLRDNNGEIVYDDYGYPVLKKEEPSFLYSWYLKFKDKYCPTIDYK